MPAVNPDRWRTLSPYLDEALEMTNGERAAWLASIHISNSALAADLRALLADHDALHESRFLERAVPLPARAALPYRTAALVRRRARGVVTTITTDDHD